MEKTKKKYENNFHKNIKKNSRILNVILISILCAGVILLLYPSASNYWNAIHQTRAIAGYTETIANMADSKYQALLEQAKAYNEELAAGETKWNLTSEEREKYYKTLDITGTGIMGYIEIRKIDVLLPIYHGTDSGVLQIAVGHVEGSSLPVTTDSYHVVLSGHRGLPSAKLFTDLNQLVEGDEFIIRILDEVYTYEVDQIRIVLPTEMNDLKIEDGKQYCTLVTCTPYGVNTHRLLVRGHLIDNSSTASDIRVIADAIQIDKQIVAVSLAAPIMLLLMTIALLYKHRKIRELEAYRILPREKPEVQNRNKSDKYIETEQARRNIL